VGGEDGGAALAEADAGMAGGFAGASEDDLVAVGEEASGFAGGKENRLRAVAGEFEETAGGGFCGARDGPGSENVSSLEIAAVAGVMGDELGRGPIEILGIGFAQQIGVELIRSHGRC
jgi:hypothetical protein